MYRIFKSKCVFGVSVSVVATLIILQYGFPCQFFFRKLFCSSSNTFYKRKLWAGGNRTVKILFYTFENIVDIRTPHYVFQNCNKSMNVSQRRSAAGTTKNEILASRIRHFKECSRGWDVVIFHVKDMPGPKVLKSAMETKVPYNQLWAYYNKESAYNTINLRNGKFDGIFDLAVTPLQTSDVPAPYGYYRERMDRNYLLSHDDVVLNKDLPIAWIASHCNEARDLLVASLMKHVPIDVYGKCGRKFKQNHKCLKNSGSCEKKLSRYKFVLAFENSFCKDYITEKYWNALYRGNIPLVYGGASYDKTLVVPKSFINVQDFKSVRALAEYLKELNKTQNYLEYHQWRNNYVIDYKPNDRHRFEIIARKLYDLLKNGDIPHEKYELSSFYGRDKNCQFRELLSRVLTFDRGG